MTMLNRFLWGGLGGLAPILATFLILEAQTIALYLDELRQGGSMLTIIGYAVRVVGLFVVGGLWAGLHKSEADPKKLFQLGIVAPAMITGMISAGHAGAVGSEADISARSAPITRPAAPAVSGQSSSRSFFGSSDRPQTDRPRPRDNDDPVKSFIRGLLGR